MASVTCLPVDRLLIGVAGPGVSLSGSLVESLHIGF